MNFSSILDHKETILFYIKRIKNKEKYDVFENITP